MKILMVLTSHDKMGDTGHKTGFWLEEFAAPYYAFLDAGAELILASPAGGQPPVDPNSDAEDAQTDATKRFKQDTRARQALANTVKLGSVKADDFDAVFYPGGHGPLWDLANDDDSIRLLETFERQEKIIGAVCHAPGIFKNVKDQNGQPLVKGRTVTGFTNSEEEGVQLTQIVPFLVEDMLKQNGANYTRGDDWASHVVVDGRLITGQNPASSDEAAKKVIQALQA
ncbi:type 1 glutamine amidotransferase domain-containing protein [Marinobacter fonticola]|uniref:type 1 glutamine amidotransferase domain-containing protein n=1 Tax=Marinobacter fonticola TaxID=2603215 RepID=UPI0011E64155|nr:type 1 glutamine amidotransferase domain-containing protein [Marinobacter fonticola]